MEGVKHTILKIKKIHVLILLTFVVNNQQLPW